MQGSDSKPVPVTGTGEGPTVIPVIVGPTAAGKSSLALTLARRFPTIEIVSADSRQIYRGISIGTAKPTREELASVPHHCIDVADPAERFSAGRYVTVAMAAIEQIRSRDKVPLIVGGTGFYLRALFEGLQAPPLSADSLDLLSRRAEREGLHTLVAELRHADPISAERIPPNNIERIIRALGCLLDTGRPYSSFLSSGSNSGSPYHPSYLYLSPPVASLNRRIEERVDEMIDNGLVDEVHRLLSGGISVDAPGLRTVGYRETLSLIAGKIDAEEHRHAIVVATRRYAKRQRTWFRRQVRADVVIDDPQVASSVAARWFNVCVTVGGEGI